MKQGPVYCVLRRVLMLASPPLPFTFPSTAARFPQGCGFLGIPAAFQASGFLLGPIVVLVLTLLCNFTKDFLLEALARLEAFTRVRARGGVDACDLCV
jgi:hypothetical protein